MSQTFVNESQEYGAYNRQPKNVNNLYQNKFTFSITKLPEASYQCQSINVPDISGENWKQVTSLNPIPRSGLNMTFGELQFSFLVDEDMHNYFEIANWMRWMYMVKNSKEYSKVKLENLQPGPDGGLVSDAQLIILTNQSVPNIVYYFRDSFPVYLGELQFSNDISEPEPQIATARFVYSFYDFDYILNKDKIDDSQ